MFPPLDVEVGKVGQFQCLWVSVCMCMCLVWCVYLCVSVCVSVCVHVCVRVGNTSPDVSPSAILNDVCCANLSLSPFTSGELLYTIHPSKTLPRHPQSEGSSPCFQDTV